MEIPSEVKKVHKTNDDGKEDYMNERTKGLMMLGIIAGQGAVIVFLMYLAFIRFPQKEFLWTSDALAVCKATRLTHASVHQATLEQFATEAAVSLNDYDYLNYRRQITDASDRYLTPHGRDQYMTALDVTGILDIIKKNYFTVTSFVPDPPQIRDKGMKAEVPFWNIEVPLTIWYATGQQRIPENRVLTMTVVAVDPSPQNPKGIAIDNIISSQRASTK
jgi:intracellular multiplication protein IcmL